jgi:peptidoglycan/LPS O-acetylase OafA/YrhL
VSASDQPPDARRIRALDGLRGLAALAVLLCHAIGLSPLNSDMDLASRLGRRLLKGLCDGGAAVDLFFVLSGYVLALPYLAILRIMPVYWAGTAVAVALRAAARPYAPWLQTWAGVDWATPLGAGDLLRFTALIFKCPIELLNGPIWSLQVEMRMSLLLPLVIAPVVIDRSVGSALVVFVVAATAPFFLEGGAFGFLPLFALGVVLAAYAPAVQARVRGLSPPARLLLGAGCVVLLWNRALHYWPYPDMRPEYLSGLASAILIALVTAPDPAPALLRSRAVLWLGDISYSLYLMHLPILLAATAALAAGRRPGYLAVAGGAVTALAGSVVLHRWVEGPSIEAGKRIVRRLAKRAPVTAGGATPKPIA